MEIVTCSPNEVHWINQVRVTASLSRQTQNYREFFSCSHLAADLNFSKYWGRRLSCPGRSIRVQVLPWTQGVRIKYKPCSSWKNENSNNLSFNLPCHFWLCMGHCCLWWRSVSAWTFLTAAAKNMKKHTIWVMHLSNVSQASCNQHHGAGNHVLHPLTRLKRRVFPESHSPTSSTALLTVLLVRKYFRKTEERKREGWLLVYRQRTETFHVYSRTGSQFVKCVSNQHWNRLFLP